MTKQKERSRAAAVSATDDWQIIKADDEEEFVGYDLLSTPVSITKYRKVTSKKEGALFQLVFNITPFYPESGGQVGDKGYLKASNGAIHYIIDTKKENDLIIHYSKTLPTDLNEKFTAGVDENQRFKTACNHTATHLMHQALRSILGTHVEQKGSMVHSGIFRFDFSHFAKLSAEEIVAVEQFVNARIKEQIPLEENRNVPYEQALSAGAMALFGEKYGDTVRTIKFGQSVELCGGTHVKNTFDIWHFKIITETAVAAGIRRIEAITGEAALKYFEGQSSVMQQLNDLLKNPQDLPKAISQLQTENNQLKKEVQQLKKLKSQILANEIQEEIETHNGIAFLAKAVDLDATGMKDLAFGLGNGRDDLFLVLGAQNGEKALLSCYVSKSLVSEKGIDASRVVRELGQYIQGGGGGQAFYATAGGKNPSGIAQALDAAKNLI
jgi:alanyl-tRNA synthetase